tara:strand:- start:160010 stop:160813 length:804 start_codon:yes stop_codon:yes gene_type:complete
MSEVNTIDQLLDEMWKDYIKLNPGAQKIVELFEARGDKVINDHIALRTFNLKKVGIDALAKPFLASGYVESGEYHFEEKKLYAKHFQHPDKTKPKIFISELLVEKFSDKLQATVKKIVEQIPAENIEKFDFTCSGRSWEVASSTYEELYAESEYAAWLSAIGYRPNHFTVFVNELESFKSLEELNEALKSAGFALNDSGGEIKGSADVYLEQSSTKADKITVNFSDKEMTIPSCYFEFAKRYPQENGELYQGFVAKSADKIFESTNR